RLLHGLTVPPAPGPCSVMGAGGPPRYAVGERAAGRPSRWFTFWQVAQVSAGLLCPVGFFGASRTRSSAPKTTALTAPSARQWVYFTSCSMSDPPETSTASTAWPLPLA